METFRLEKRLADGGWTSEGIGDTTGYLRGELAAVEETVLDFARQDPSWEGQYRFVSEETGQSTGYGFGFKPRRDLLGLPMQSPEVSPRLTRKSTATPDPRTFKARRSR